jgi:hypothetical protein
MGLRFYFEFLRRDLTGGASDISAWDAEPFMESSQMIAQY